MNYMIESDEPHQQIQCVVLLHTIQHLLYTMHTAFTLYGQ